MEEPVVMEVKEGMEHCPFGYSNLLTFQEARLDGFSFI